MHIPCDIGLWLQFDIFGPVHWPYYRAIHDGMRNPYLTLNLGLFAQYQGAWLIIGCRYIAAHTPVYAQTTAEGNIPFDDRARPDQAVNAILRFWWFGSKHFSTPLTTDSRSASTPVWDCRSPTRAPAPF